MKSPFIIQKHNKYTGILLILFGLSALAFTQNPDPFTESQLVAMYRVYRSAQQDTLNLEDIQFFIEEVIKGHGINFAPTRRVRERLQEGGLDPSIIKSLQDEIYQHRGVELYVFDFSAAQKESGHEFAQLIHREVEIQKPRILDFMERKNFPPEAIAYDTWKSNISSQYTFYVTGDISRLDEVTTITAKIRFRPAYTSQDLSVEIKPLEFRTNPDRETANKIATWFVDAIIGLFSD